MYQLILWAHACITTYITLYLAQCRRSMEVYPGWQLKESILSNTLLDFTSWLRRSSSWFCNQVDNEVYRNSPDKFYYAAFQLYLTTFIRLLQSSSHAWWRLQDSTPNVIEWTSLLAWFLRLCWKRKCFVRRDWWIEWHVGFNLIRVAAGWTQNLTWRRTWSSRILQLKSTIRNCKVTGKLHFNTVMQRAGGTLPSDSRQHYNDGCFLQYSNCIIEINLLTVVYWE